MAAKAALAAWIKDQKPKGPGMKDAPTFYRNLEEALDIRRADHALFVRTKSAWKTGEAIDFCSNDLLSLGATGQMRTAFLEELARHPDFSMHAGGSRLMDGNYDYIEKTEQEIADFHGAETALIVCSGYAANSAIYSAIPRPGDAIVYDELVHASTLDGMAQSLAQTKVAFRHNDPDSFRETLASVVDSQAIIRDGSRSVLVSVESVYSMDGDVCPLMELLAIAKEVCPKGNAVFIVDEAHGAGILGRNGRGLVNALGVEKEIAVRLTTCGKALASTGAIILGNQSVRSMLINFARSIIYTTAPSFPSVAAIRAAYNLLSSGATQKPQSHIPHLVHHFFTLLSHHPTYSLARSTGLLSIPLMDAWESSSPSSFTTHIVPLWTRHRHTWSLFFHLQLAGLCVYPIDHPAVPRGQSRIRLMFHGRNTEEEVRVLVEAICGFAEEMAGIEREEREGGMREKEKGEGGMGVGGGKGGGGKMVRMPRAAQQVYALMASGGG